MGGRGKTINVKTNIITAIYIYIGHIRVRESYLHEEKIEIVRNYYNIIEVKFKLKLLNWCPYIFY